MSDLAVTLTVAQLQAVVRQAVRDEIDARPTASDVITRDEAAALLKVHPKVVVRYVTRDGLPAKRLGKEWRFLRSEILRWLEGRSVQSKATLHAINGGR